jgi:tetratricopeptide (TPR) repeat protein
MLAACATIRARRPTDLRFDEHVIVGNPKRDADIAKLNDEELFACGTASYAAEEYDRASRCFARLADAFPSSRHKRPALYNAGLAYERLSQWELAIDRYHPLMDAEKGTGDAIDAAFRTAECYYHLNNFEPAIQILTTLANRKDLDVGVSLEAITQKGICLLEAGDLEAAETALRQSLKRYEDEKERERLDDYFPAQAQFFLGELYRIHYASIVLDPNGGEDKTAKDLELKCEMLLSAQGHYVRAIRIGNGQWATASGFRIGSLYEDLYDHMIHAPVPKEFDEEQTDLYRKELRRRVQVLVTKAIAIYEPTLSAAERIGVDTPFVKKTREALERMKAILLADGNPKDDAKQQGASAPSTTAKETSPSGNSVDPNANAGQRPSL